MTAPPDAVPPDAVPPGAGLHWSAPLRRRPVPVALGCLAVAALVGWRIGLRPDLPAFLVLAVLGTLLGVVDVALKRLPEPLTLPGIGLGLALLGAAVPFTYQGSARMVVALVGAVLLWAFYAIQWFLLPAGTIGFGDATLAAMLGLHLAWLGTDALLLGMLATLVSQLVVAVSLLVLRRAGRGTTIPYGPFLLGGTLVAVLVHAA